MRHNNMCRPPRDHCLGHQVGIFLHYVALVVPLQLCWLPKVIHHHHITALLPQPLPSPFPLSIILFLLQRCWQILPQKILLGPLCQQLIFLSLLASTQQPFIISTTRNKAEIIIICHLPRLICVLQHMVHWLCCCISINCHHPRLCQRNNFGDWGRSW